ncbi:hypothetical protein B0H63DRAFT_509167 [Podospora didyma]|uniref:Ankyrin n=1 Tax=Podospora didyma TaxID=330526 RepID=A0AAE0U1Q1_9PEZI|nr:hypothetical protein B0H63DRAFT_509167 [Podospora didyma]
MASPASVTARASPGGSRIGRPPQWTISRSRKLARLYLYTTLSIEKIIKVMEDDVFKPRKNSAQKTIHKMLDNDPRYLRPESRVEMDVRISNLAKAPGRRRKRPDTSPPTIQRQREALNRAHREQDVVLSSIEVSSASGSSRMAEDTPSAGFESSATSGWTPTTPGADDLGHGQFSIPIRSYDTERPQTSASSGTSVSMIRDLQRRVSNCSTNYAQQISVLLKEFTIASASDDDMPFEHRSSIDLSEPPGLADSPDIQALEAFEAFPEPGFALPGDFLSAHSRNCADFPGQEHGSGRCWCAIAAATSRDEGSWLHPTGELRDTARRVLGNPSPANLNLRDCFGNTPLHLFAALEGYQEALFGILFNSSDVSATNNANQTFLHVLNLEWFSDIDSPAAPLKQLLAFLRQSAPDLVYETDVYGRNFFHRAHALIRDPNILASILSPYNPALSSRRDSFGFSPLSHTQLGGEGPFIPPRRPTPQQDDSIFSHGSPRPGPRDEGSFLAYHAHLVQVIQSSYNNPRVEDASNGRNGLHCLAEAIIHQQAMDEQRSVMTKAARPLKRKTNQSDPAPSSSSTAHDEGILTTRLRHLEGLLHSGVDVNDYDKAGNTVLMAFITHIADEDDDKSKTLLSILETILRAGARIEARNRCGETALLVAARLGRKVALTTLLEHGAGVHARDVHGRGVLEVLDQTCRGARDDTALYARVEACRVLLTGRRDWGVVQRPGVVEEWRTRGGVGAV